MLQTSFELLMKTDEAGERRVQVATGDEKRPTAVTVVIDNNALGLGMAKQWGLSFWIEAAGSKVLLDCGASRAFLRNARALGLPLHELDALVLSHGHYDHSGSLAQVIAAAPGARLVVHPGALVPRYNLEKTGKRRPIGLPDASLAALREQPERTTWATGPTPVAPGVWASGPLPRRHPLELAEPAFFLDDACTIHDEVVDDQALWIETPEGLIVLCGCAHAGVINTIEHVRAVAADRGVTETSEPSEGGAAMVRAVLGGFHLLQAKKDRLQATADYLESLDLEVCAPCHCTGKRATALLRARLGAAFVEIGSGARLTF
jgi:7,8-dihydropterin-6-yl-methyl-4-(beta-D-ribofuranosyl)aminobenzene 5'-phosphate synthase